MSRGTTRATTCWLVVVGAFYLLRFVACAIVGAPIEVEGPTGTLSRAATGDPLARFVVDTWVTLGLMFGALGVVLLAAAYSTRRERGVDPGAVRWLVLAVCAVEASNFVADVYKLVGGAEGTAVTAALVWMPIHLAIIACGWFASRLTR